MIIRAVLFTILVTLTLSASDLAGEPELVPTPGQNNLDPGVLIREAAVQNAAARAMGVCDGTKQIVCESCNVLRVCLGATQTVPCPTDQPYCNYGTMSDRCSPTPIEGACDDDLRNAAVTCSAVGKFPDASNCRIYHECSNVGDSSSVYSCPVGYVFNAAVQFCARENVFSRCLTLQCDNRYVGHVRYGLSRQFYGFCDGSGLKPIVFKCPAGASFVYSTGSTFGECVYLCPRQGNFPNSNDPATYFQCFWWNFRLRFNIVHCSPGMTFNVTLRYCT